MHLQIYSLKPRLKTCTLKQLSCLYLSSLFECVVGNNKKIQHCYYLVYTLLSQMLSAYDVTSSHLIAVM